MFHTLEIKSLEWKTLWQLTNLKAEQRFLLLAFVILHVEGDQAVVEDPQAGDGPHVAGIQPEVAPIDIERTGLLQIREVVAKDVFHVRGQQGQLSFTFYLRWIHGEVQ